MIKHDIKMTRGDTNYQFRFQRLNADGTIIFTLPEKIYFTVKINSDVDNFLFQKRLGAGIVFNSTDGVYTIQINPEDTNNLDYGDYKYDIEIIDDGKVKTRVKGTLEITQEVTWAENEG